ncbi:M16 family metallopeptidase [Qipengyuania aquimaris]|uniref:M16 family metallopeptidase n=1 Tax=Qipengyuania aquimaris TaxID=255984 RepID=UPI001FD1AC9F|nr:insulinase family protein [Qipengyuania aquimaris]UOR14439.1 insulinase family protein [Qipengyuania aquimaris]
MTDFSRAARRLALFLPALLLVPQTLPAQDYPAPASVQAEDEVPWIYENSDVPRDEEWVFGKLDNGLRYGVRENGVPPGQVSIRVRIDAGSLHEEDSELGFAHLLEHLLFRESQYLGPAEAIPRWQKLGATFGSDTNAETSPTHTVYKLDLPNVDPAKFEESMMLISGMVRGPVLSDANVRAEVPIVLAEKRERGGVSERVSEANLQTLFAGQRMAERITIGTEDTLRAANGTSVKAFYDRWYRPENTVISVVGDLDPNLLAAMVEKYFDGWEGKGPSVEAPDFGDPVAPPGADPANPVGDVAVIVEPTLPRSFTYGYFRPWRQVNDTIIYNEGRLEEQLALLLINRRLEARARAGGSYLYAQASEDKFSRSTHATLVQFAPLTDDWQAALADVRAVIADALANPPTREEMERELDEMEVGYANYVEQRSVLPAANFADDLVNAVDIREAIAAPETFLMVFNSMREKATPESVLETTRDLFSGPVIRATYVTPTAADGDETVLRTALLERVDAAANARLAAQTISFEDLPAIGEPGQIVSRGPHGIGDVERIVFDNGVTALLQANSFEPGRTLVKVRFGAGYLAFDPEDAAYIQLGQSSMFSTGLGELGQEELDRIRTGRKLGLDFAIGDGTFSFSAQTRRQDLADQLYLFAAKLGMPRWDANPVLRSKAAAQLAYESYAATPGGVLSRDLNYFLYDELEVFRTATPDMLAAADIEGYREVWEPILEQGPVEVLIFGDYDKEQAVEVLSKTFGALPDRKPIPAEVAARAYELGDAGETVVRFHKGEANQAAAVIAWPAGAGRGGIRESRQLAILTEVISNRLLDSMRERSGASYSPSVRLDWPTDVESGGSIVGLAQLQPKDVPVFFSEADRIARELAETPPTAEELARAAEPLRNYYERLSSGNYFFMTELEGSTTDPRRMRALRGFLQDYVNPSPERMLELAQRYLAESAWRMAVLPEGQELATRVPSGAAQSGR